MEDEKEIRCLRINNIHWMAHLAEPIIKYTEILKHPTITSQSMHMHLANIAGAAQQTDLVELWGVFHGDQCVAFADWCVKSSPFIGTVYMENIYSWNRKKEPVKLLLKEWINYGERKFTKPYFMADIINESVMKVFDKHVSDFGYEYKRTGTINVIGRKK
jgi:hypothetical protein